MRQMTQQSAGLELNDFNIFLTASILNSAIHPIAHEVSPTT